MMYIYFTLELIGLFTFTLVMIALLFSPVWVKERAKDKLFEDYSPVYWDDTDGLIVIKDRKTGKCYRAENTLFGFKVIKDDSVDWSIADTWIGHY